MCVVIVNFGCKKLLLLIYAGAFAPAIFTTEERGINMLDLLKSITSIFLTVCSFIVLIWGLGDSIILGFVLAFLCLAASFLVLQSVSSDTWSEVKQQQDLKRERQICGVYERNRYGYICPCCGYPAAERVDNKEEGYTYRCRNCRYIW